MYEQFFGLRERPFDLTPNPKYLVLTESHREALQSLEFGIGARDGMTLLLGDAGSGKTTVIRAAIERLPVRVHAVHLHNPTLSKAEFVEMLAAHFGLSEAASRSKAAMLLELEKMLRERRRRGEMTALVVDEAQSLPLELLEEIRLLANIETDSEKLMTVIVAGQPELGVRLNHDNLRQFKQRIGLRCELRPLLAKETAAYLAGRIRAAGGVGSQVFTRDAVEMIYRHSQGLPRLVNLIAHNAMLGAFAAGKRPVDSDVIREICDDFDLKDAPSSASPRAAAVPNQATAANLVARQSTTAPAIRIQIDHGILFGAIAATYKRFLFWS